MKLVLKYFNFNFMKILLIFSFSLSYLLHTTALLHPQQVPQQPEHTATLLHTFHLLSYMYASHFVSECSATHFSRRIPVTLVLCHL